MRQRIVAHGADAHRLLCGMRGGKPDKINCHHGKKWYWLTRLTPNIIYIWYHFCNLTLFCSKCSLLIAHFGFISCFARRFHGD